MFSFIFTGKYKLFVFFMIRLRDLQLIANQGELAGLPKGKLLINTINAFSYVNARKDKVFAEALMKGDVLIPDGSSIVLACKWLGKPDCPTERVAGWDLFKYEMDKLNENGGGKVLFLGSSDEVLEKIRKNAASVYPNIQVLTYSPPYCKEFSEEDSAKMVSLINDADPDLLWIGMTAPKQEKWIYSHWNQLDIHCHCGTVGAVFDFFAGTKKRAPLWFQRHSLEWLYRFMKEPRRMWKRYIIGNTQFILCVVGEKCSAVISHR